ncbi:MAG: PAS domain S-box protein [Bacteroidetes bacterium]|nr:PAS domain S-box protein [Bacteroidota bacterium]
MPHSSDAAAVNIIDQFATCNPHPVLLARGDGVLHYANEAARPLLLFWGCSEGDALPAEWIEIIAGVRARGTRFDTELYTDKTLLYISVVAAPDSEHVHIYGYDATEKSRDRRRLEESEDLFRRVFHTTPDAVCINRLSDGLFIDVNQGFTLLTGYEREKIIGRTSPGILIWANIDDRVDFLDRMQRQGVVRNLEAAFRMKDGSVRTGLLSGQLILFHGELHILTITRDIEDIKRTREALRRSEARMRSLQDNLPVALYRSTPEGEIIYANPAMARMLGFDSVESLHKTRTDDLYASTEERNQVLSVLRKHGLIKDWEVRLRHRDGNVVDCALNIQAVFDEDGRLHYLDGIINDITDRKRVHRELMAAKEKAEEMNRIKSNFLATMSHELRTPLNGILGFASLLEETLEERPELQEMATVILSSGMRLLDTLNSILDLSIVEADKLNVHWEQVDVRTVIREVGTLYKANAVKKGLDFGIGVPDQPLSVHTDQRLLRQILSNLTNNAVKYTKSGRIAITADSPEDLTRNGITVHVEDTGIGIAEQDLHVIFDEFRQASEGYTRAYDGSGLGLSVSQKFAHVLGGRITVESTPGAGSRFSLHLPGIRD